MAVYHFARSRLIKVFEGELLLENVDFELASLLEYQTI
jgi:hypothetical protein